MIHKNEDKKKKKKKMKICCFFFVCYCKEEEDNLTPFLSVIVIRRVTLMRVVCQSRGWRIIYNYILSQHDSTRGAHQKRKES